VEASEEISDLEKCTKLHALNADKNAKYHSSQQRVSQFFAKNAIRKRKDINS
jgi:hypothetical protein